MSEPSFIEPFVTFPEGAERRGQQIRRGRISLKCLALRMMIKSNTNEVESYLADASYMRDGHADLVMFPESAEEAGEVLAKATSDRTPVTVSGAGTGTVGGRVAFRHCSRY